MKKIVTIILFFSVILAIACCSKSNTASAPGQKAKGGDQKAPQVVAPLREEDRVEREAYNYEPKGRDPFLSLVDVAKEKPQRKKGATPFENFDISEIKLNAIVWDSTQFYALMTLPDNKSYTVRQGTILGLYGGKVSEITKNSVLIREQLKDYKGQYKTKETILRLRKEGGE